MKRMRDMDHAMTQLAQMMNSIVHYQKLALDMLNQFYGADGSLVVEFDGELRTFASWRSGGIEYLKELETAIAHQWMTISNLQTTVGYPAVNGITIHRWQLAEGNACIAAYLEGTERTRLTAWCVILPREGHAIDETRLAILGKLAESAQVIHIISKGFLEVTSHGVLNVALAETSPWGLIAVDRQGRPRMMNARARSIVSRNNGILLQDGRVRLMRSSADRTLQSSITASIGRNRTDDEGTQVVAVPDKNGRILYAVEVRSFSSMNEVMGELGVVLLITDFDRERGASGQVLAKIFSLSERESEFAEVFGRGYRIDETARIMRISPNTARVHLQHVLRKTGTQSQVELAHVLSRLPCSMGNEAVPPPTVSGAGLLSDAM